MMVVVVVVEVYLMKKEVNLQGLEKRRSGSF